MAAWPLFHIHVIAAFALPYAADAAVEPIGILLVKRKGGVSLKWQGLIAERLTFIINQVVKLCSFTKTRLNISLRKSQKQKRCHYKGLVA